MQREHTLFAGGGSQLFERSALGDHIEHVVVWREELVNGNPAEKSGVSAFPAADTAVIRFNFTGPASII